MTPQAQIVLILWLPLVILFLISYKPRTAIIMSYIGGMLFLPKSIAFKIPGLANYGGDTATSYALLLGLIFLKAGTLSQFKLKWIDLPMIITCISPAFASLSNGLGIKDAIKATVTQIFVWGVPYFLSRTYINQWSGLKELSLSIIKGGLLYVPLCLYEIKMAPLLHKNIYGYFAHSSGISEAVRFGGWRPQVFMTHGLVVAMWMVSATILAIWLWKTKAYNKIWQIPKIWIVVSLVITFILMKSTGAIIYLLYTILIIVIARFWKMNIPVWILIVGIICFLLARVTGLITTQSLMIVNDIFPPDRSQSLSFRLENEDKLRVKALEHPIFGWGGWGRSRIYEENWEGDIVDVSVLDSFWMITFGANGLLGLLSAYIALFLPVILFLLRYPAKTWFDSKIALGASLSIVLLIFILDTMFNAPIIAILPIICGSLSSIVIQNQTSKVTKKQAKKPLTVNS